MERVWTLRAMVAGVALVASMWTGMAGAEEQFQMMAGIQAQALSHSEMAAVEGKGPNALSAIAFLGPDGFIAFVDGKRSNPLFIYDPNALNPNAEAALTAFGILDPEEGLVSILNGDRDAPLFLYDPTSLFNPPSGQDTLLGLPDFSGFLGSLPIPGGGDDGGFLALIPNLSGGGRGGFLALIPNLSGGRRGGFLALIPNLSGRGNNGLPDIGGLLALVPTSAGGVGGLPDIGGLLAILPTPR